MRVSPAIRLFQYSCRRGREPRYGKSQRKKERKRDRKSRWSRRARNSNAQRILNHKNKIEKELM